MMSFYRDGLPDDPLSNVVYGMLFILIGAFFLSLFTGSDEIAHMDLATFLELAALISFNFGVGTLVVMVGMRMKFEKAVARSRWPGDVSWEKWVVYTISGIFGLTMVFYLLFYAMYVIAGISPLTVPGMDFFYALGVVVMTYTGIALFTIRFMRPKKPAWQTDYKIIKN